MSETIDDLYIEEYSERSFVMRGNTRAYKENLKALGGKYNSRLRDNNSEEGVSPGWIFSKTKLVSVTEFLETGDLSQPKDTIKTVPKKTISVKTENCPHCSELSEKVQELSGKIDKILAVLDKNEARARNVMSGASSMMKNMFGSPMTQAAFSFVNPTENESDLDNINILPMMGNSITRMMAPPAVNIVEEILEETGPTAILLE